MYFQDLSTEQLDKIKIMLRMDKEVCTQNTIQNRIELGLSKNKLFELQEEEIDDYLNCNNNNDIVMTCLEEAYE